MQFPAGRAGDGAPEVSPSRIPFPCDVLVRQVRCTDCLDLGAGDLHKRRVWTRLLVDRLTSIPGYANLVAESGTGVAGWAPELLSSFVKGELWDCLLNLFDASCLVSGLRSSY